MSSWLPTSPACARAIKPPSSGTALLVPGVKSRSATTLLSDATSSCIPMKRGLPSRRDASLNSPVSAMVCSRQRSSSWPTSRPTSLPPASLACRPSSSEKPKRPWAPSRLACKPHHLLSPTLFDLHRVERRTLWKERVVEASTRHLVLAAAAVIDLLVHTTFSDGSCLPGQLIDCLLCVLFV